MSVTIDRSQGTAIWEAIDTWQNVYLKEQGEFPEFTRANLSKSCLLGRILYEGKEPLPEPPPLSYAAPWYELVETGSALLTKDWQVSGPHEKLNTEDEYLIISGYPWMVRSNQQEQYVLSWMLGGRKQTGKVHSSTWLLRPLTPVETTSTVTDDAVIAVDCILERIV